MILYISADSQYWNKDHRINSEFFMYDHAIQIKIIRLILSNFTTDPMEIWDWGFNGFLLLEKIELVLKFLGMSCIVKMEKKD